jgi:hypothetical protein
VDPQVVQITDAPSRIASGRRRAQNAEAGEVQFTFILVTEDSDLVKTAVSTLTSQLGDPLSVLRSGSITSALVEGQVVVSRFVCPGGTMQSETSASCLPCQAGKAGTGGECISCGVGTQPDVDRTACENCAEGMFSASGSACISCITTGFHTPDRITCLVCDAGKQPTSEKTACVECAAGYAGTGGECKECDAGSQPTSAKSACAACPAKTTAAAGHVCTPCGDGTAPNDGTDGSAAQSICLPCGYGKAGTGGECGSCDSGEYAPAGASECESCAAGQADHDLDPSTKCEPCAVGRFAQTSAANGVQSCVSCPQARNSTSGATACMLCPELHYGYVHGGNGSCRRCAELELPRRLPPRVAANTLQAALAQPATCAGGRPNAQAS